MQTEAGVADNKRVRVGYDAELCGTSGNKSV